MRTAGLLILIFAAGCSSRALGPDALKQVDASLRHRYVVQFTARSAEYNATTQPAERKRIRNEIVTGLLAADEYDFQVYASKMGFAHRTFAVGSDVAVLALSTGAALSGGSATLAALAAVVSGSRIAFDKEVFYEQAAPMLLDRMRALRAQKREQIDIKLLSLPDDVYNLNAAVIDVLDYFQAGTLSAAVSSISFQTEKIRRTAEGTTQP